MIRKFVVHLKDYCANCTLAGLSYIANHELHFIERIFWLFCFVFSAVGSYYLIDEYESHFEERAVSIVYESLPPNQRIYFPSVSVCRMKKRGSPNPELENYADTYVETDAPKGTNVYQVEEFLTQILYPYDIIGPKVKGSCLVKSGGLQCPDVDYRKLLKTFQPKCSDFFEYCSLSGKPFDCCRFFVSLTSPYGKCFTLNSLINNKPYSYSWFDSTIDRASGDFALHLVLKLPAKVIILNEEDIAYTNLPSVFMNMFNVGAKFAYIFVERMVNDADVRELSVESRKCRFPDEVLPDSGYEVYSFSTCYMDCMRFYQMKYCNCTLYNYLPTPVPQYPDCSLNGLICLDDTMLLKPDSSTFVPWSEKFPCECLPSCNENDIQHIYESELLNKANAKTFNITISMSDLPAHQYRRQALRTRLDIVVTIGGILGLFMGASVLSAMEFVYYFTIRLYSNVRMRL